MSNIAGKAYAMNLVTPLQRWQTPVNRAAFWAVGTPLLAFSLRGLLTLSMIHYARWVFLRARDFPRLSDQQPEESLHYDYMLFLSNFNGSWAQYVDSFSVAIPSGLNLLWFMNVGWPKSVPQTRFHEYVTHNQVWSNHYYSAYPLAASNDVKAGSKVRKRLVDFVRQMRRGSAEHFAQNYGRMLRDLQGELSMMDVTPAVSTAAQAIADRSETKGPAHA
ncbi:MAG TPA: hypothetical protein VF331_21905 [Polyangiales bacterium]